MVQVSKRLVIKKEVPIDNSKDLVNSLDVAMAEYYCKNKNFEKGLQAYREILPLLQDKEYNSAFNLYINYSLTYAKQKVDEKKWAEAIEI